MDLFSPHPLGNLNEPEMLVYRYIMEHPNTVPFMRIRELAAEAHVSTTTVLHFCKKMGCDAVGKDNIISAAHWPPSTSGTKSRCSSWRTASVPSTS